MAKSKLRSHHMRTCWTDSSVRNAHRLDEMPKNKPSKFVTTHCSTVAINWLEDSTSFGGHSRPKGGHRRVSGLVRARIRREIRKMILEQQDEKER